MRKELLYHLDTSVQYVNCLPNRSTHYNAQLTTEWFTCDVRNLVGLGIIPHFRLILPSSMDIIPHFQSILPLKVNAIPHFDGLYQLSNSHVYLNGTRREG